MTVKIITGDCRQVLPTMADESVHCIVTSPPYWGLRDYGYASQIGMEHDLGGYVSELVSVLREARRVLRPDGTLWLNLGDCYAGGGGGGNQPGSPHRKQATNKGSIVRGKRDAKRWGGGNNPAHGGVKAKDLFGAPRMVAFALRADGWYLRSEIIWAKPNPMPESVTDRPTSSHEKIFLLAKLSNYYYDAAAVAEDAVYSGLAGQSASGFKDARQFNGKHPDKQRGHSRLHAGFNDRWDKMTKAGQCSGKRNARNVWMIPTQPFPGKHFAVFPDELARRCILAGCPEDGVVLDPFSGAGTVGLVADRLGRNAILIEANPDYAKMAGDRIIKDSPLLGTVNTQTFL